VLLLGVVSVAAVSTMCISIQSFKKLYGSRTRLDILYSDKMYLVRELRDKAKGDDVRNYDPGDYMFLVLGIIAPILAVLLVYCQLFLCCA
jgi:hypothetical protein